MLTKHSCMDVDEYRFGSTWKCVPITAHTPNIGSDTQERMHDGAFRNAIR